MPTARKPYSIPIPTFGVNYTSNVLTIRREEVYKALNMHLDENGVFRSRKGSSLLNTTALDGAVTSVYDFRRPSGTSTTSVILVTAGLKLYTFDGTTFTAIQTLTSSERPVWATFQDGSANVLAFMANGTDFFQYDGTTVSAVTFVTSIDKPRYLMVYDDRLFATGTDSDPFRVWYSATLDGTDWTGGNFWTVKSHSGDRVMGVSTAYDYALFFTQYSVDIITEADSASGTSKQITVTREYGTSSHWSIQAIGNAIYFVDESHIYKGVLRAAVDNGLDVTEIDDNIFEKYKEVSNSTDIVSVYDPEHKAILWGVKTLWNTRSNLTFVYSLARSGPKGELGQVDVWAGWFEGTGYEPYTLSSVVLSDGSVRLYRGDEDGYVYQDKTQFHKTFKDEKRVSDATVDKPIVSEITTGAIMPGGISARKRARKYFPYLYQKYDAAVKVQWIVDGRYIEPDISASNRMITLYNRVPYWRTASTTKMKQLWANTVWNNEFIPPRPISINEPFAYIQFVLRCEGTNDRDEISYSGGELKYQRYGDTGRMVG